MFVSVSPTCMYVYCVYIHWAHGDQKKTANPLQPEPWVTANCHMGAEN